MLISDCKITEAFCTDTVIQIVSSDETSSNTYLAVYAGKTNLKNLGDGGDTSVV